MKDTVFIVGAAVVAVAAGVLILTSGSSSNTSSGSSDSSGSSTTSGNNSSGSSTGTSQANNPIPAWEGYSVPAYYQWHSAFNYDKIYTSYVNSQSLFNSINASLGYTNK